MKNKINKDSSNRLKKKTEYIETGLPRTEGYNCQRRKTILFL